MLRPGADKPKNANPQDDKKVADELKDEARARILDKLIAHGEVSGTRDEIRAQLGLEDMTMKLFKNSCWHLRWGDRKTGLAPQIVMYRVGEEDRGWRSNERQPFIIKLIPR
jgi:DNA-binding transcriptional ArsR family regulator